MGSGDFRLGVLVSGRGTNLQAIIDHIEQKKLSATIAIVLSNVEKVHALERAKKHGLETVFLNPQAYSSKQDYDRALIEQLRSRAVDLVCLAGYMRILGKELIETFAGRILNIHPSLLPAFPGLNPQKQALEHGVKVSGCTVHLVDETVDGGPIILQSPVPVHESDDEESLSARILEQEHTIYPQAIRLFLENRLKVSGRKVLLKKP